MNNNDAPLSTPMFARIGRSSTVVHIAYYWPGENRLATECDGWGGTGARTSTVRLVNADAATCKTCLKIVAAR